MKEKSISVYNKTMICLSLTSSTLDEITAVLHENARFIDCAELRADMVNDAKNVFSSGARAADENHAEIFADNCARWAQSLTCTNRLGTPPKIIFTLRVQKDGGRCTPEHEALRRHALRRVIASGAFDYVDVEADNVGFCAEMYNQLYGNSPHDCVSTNSVKTQLIVSRHFFSAAKAFGAMDRDTYTAPWLEHARADANYYPCAIIKCAVMCETSAHLRMVLQAARELRENNECPAGYVLASMGDFGKPARILTAHTGSLWTYASAPRGEQAAPGHYSPQELVELYRYHDITERTRVFAVVGNPVQHSRSPLYHNKGFRDQNIDAVYVHMAVDNCAELPAIAGLINARGFSVTIPHKGDVINFLNDADEETRHSGSCNTVIIDNGAWRGYNTDMGGFLAPLQQRLKKQISAAHAAASRGLSDMSCVIVGCGGTARALVHALLMNGAPRLLIVNRTVQKAEAVAKNLAARYSAEVCHGTLKDYETIAKFSDIIVQTTNVGMRADKSALHDTPLPNYPFTGKELVYDVIYTPKETPLLRDAAAKGCAVIYGEEMFIEQARLQSRLFCIAASAAQVPR